MYQQNWKVDPKAFVAKLQVTRDQLWEAIAANEFKLSRVTALPDLLAKVEGRKGVKIERTEGQGRYRNRKYLHFHIICPVVIDGREYEGAYTHAVLDDPSTLVKLKTVLKTNWQIMAEVLQELAQYILTRDSALKALSIVNKIFTAAEPLEDVFTSPGTAYFYFAVLEVVETIIAGKKIESATQFRNWPSLGSNRFARLIFNLQLNVRTLQDFNNLDVRNRILNLDVA